jgi:hypothetical protein
MTSRTIDEKSQRNQRRGAAALVQVSLPRLYLLRFGYLVVAIGLAARKWPLIVSHERPWPLFEGVETCMLLALSLLFFLGLRYPIKMLPILLFEIGWKLIWFAVIVVPLWRADHVDAATLSTLYDCLWVVIVVAVIPWRYVVRQYVIGRGDAWRPARSESVD